MNDRSEWVIAEVPELRIIDDELWAKVKKRQLDVGASFIKTDTNRLNRTHRPKYLFSGRLECGICGGPYSITANARFGCKNRSKHLPIEHLGREICPNSRTISRRELENRVLDAIPANLLSVENTASIQAEVNKQITAAKNIDERNKEKLQAELRDVAKRQDVIAAQITQRIMNGQSPIDAFNRMLDGLQQRSSELQSVLSTATKKRSGPAKTFTISPSLYANTIQALTYIARTGNTEHDAVQQHFDFLRSLVQKIIITPSSDGKAAELSIIGRLASILASMRAFQDYSAGIKERHRNEFARRVRAGEFKDRAEKMSYLHRFEAVLAEEETSWRRLQVSVVAGAGFEPAAFRL
jgi:hypothetical protein